MGARVRRVRCGAAGATGAVHRCAGAVHRCTGAGGGAQGHRCWTGAVLFSPAVSESGCPPEIRRESSDGDRSSFGEIERWFGLCRVEVIGVHRFGQPIFSLAE